MAYALGFIFADGSVFINRRGGCFLELTSTDLELIIKLKKIFSSNHTIGVRPKNNSRKKVGYRLQIGSKELLKDLKKFGVIQNKSLVIEFPKVPNKYLGDFVRGYFDGDGGVSFGKYWRENRSKWQWVLSTRFTSGSKGFLIGLANSLSKYLEGGFIRQKSDKSGFDLILSYRDAAALFKLMYNNTRSSVFLKRKYLTLKKAFRVLDYQVMRA